MFRLSAAYEDSIGQAYAYDPANQVTHSRVNIANPAGANATTSPTHAYTYDKAGNRTSSLAFGQSSTYAAYNVNVYTLVSGGGFQPPSPTFDNKGNCPCSTHALRFAESSSGFWLFSPLLTQIGQSLTQPRANGTTQTLTWDAHDRLRTATALATPSTTAQMFYDPLGLLTWVRRPDGANPPIDEIWSWSSWTLLSREVRQGSTPLDTLRYTWGPDLSGTLEDAGGVRGLLGFEHAPGTSTTWDIRHHHYDANGNVLALTNATGQVSARYRYSSFGELISSSDLDSSGWNTRNIHRFNTKPEVARTGLLYYGYRWYDAQTDRWPSRDPIRERGGINLYGFVGNSPITHSDVLGLKWEKKDCKNASISGGVSGYAGFGSGADVTITGEICNCCNSTTGAIKEYAAWNVSVSVAARVGGGTRGYAGLKIVFNGKKYKVYSYLGYSLSGIVTLNYEIASSTATWEGASTGGEWLLTSGSIE